ncbi:MAG: ABC transporter permease [Actinobacteria bacterium]|nr:ABC transporter permease [Actinomycetota bacterium]
MNGKPEIGDPPHDGQARGATRRPRSGRLTPGQIRFITLVRREITRFVKIKRQTLGAPLLETFLYISVFGAALGSRIKQLHGVDYVVFIIPGLIMMAWATNAFSNNSSSILQQKFQGAIQDQLSSPASPAELLLGFSLGGFLRGMMVSSITFVVASLMIDLPVDHPFVLLAGIFLVGFFFSQLGVLVGVRAEQFDDVAFYQTFVLQPLIFLGGVFYSAALLPEPFQTLTQFNPVYYMINLVRYGFIGYSEANIALSLGFLTVATAALLAVNLRLFRSGYRLRA